ncbi:unnamed protein product [Thelazia callipaeda]|uniref:C-CAP/cofactor C-like domain-containing protein n=1 Tax=Thelazia callipaeda TaxID=103827 RepID=A0A0N5D069_THECL|nr:unnamed protein product [Thelazia callipaeda]
MLRSSTLDQKELKRRESFLRDNTRPLKLGDPTTWPRRWGVSLFGIGTGLLSWKYYTDWSRKPFFYSFFARFAALMFLGGVGYVVGALREYHYKTRDAVIEHYISLHPNDFSHLIDYDLFIKKRQRVLARLEARHSQQTVGVKKLSTSTDFDDLLTKVSQLISSSDSSIKPEFLHELETALTIMPPGHQSRRMKEALNVLRSRMQEQVGLASHQSVFSFAAESNATELPKSQTTVAESNALELPQSKTPIAGSISLGTNQTVVRLQTQSAVQMIDKHDEEITLVGNDNDEVVISNVVKCIVRVPFRASAVHMKSVKHTTLVFAPVRTSFLIRNCEDLTMAVAAQQVRIHDSHEIRLYIEVRAALIIEDCDGIQIAPYNVVGFQSRVENDSWCNVYDFSWLSTEEHSPNWKMMTENLDKCFNL